MLELRIEEEAVLAFLSTFEKELTRKWAGTLSTWASSTKESFIRRRLSGNPVRRVTGGFQRSMKSYSTERTAYVWSDAPYARIRDIGGVIRPKNARWLVIPAKSQLTAGGKKRWQSLRELDGVFFRRVASTGRLYAFRKLPNGRVQKVATLVKQVNVPAGNLTAQFAPEQFSRLTTMMDKDVAAVLR